MLHQNRDSLLELVDSISALTDNAVQAGPGPYGIGTSCSHPSKLSVIVSMEPDFVRPSPDESEELWGYEPDQEVTVTLKAYDGREHKMLDREQMNEAFAERGVTPAYANAIRTLLDTKITASGREMHQVFDVLVDRELASQDTELDLSGDEDLTPTMGLG